MVDAAVSNTVGSDIVRVRVPPPALEEIVHPDDSKPRSTSVSFVLMPMSFRIGEEVAESFLAGEFQQMPLP